MKKKYILLFFILNSFTSFSQSGCVTDISNNYSTISVFTSNNGNIYSWGLNDNNQVGNGSNAKVITTPWLRPKALDFSVINHCIISSAGLTTNGKIYTWGDNIRGQLGNGTTTNTSVPAQVNNDTDWTKVSMGWIHAVALKSNGTLWGWGNNNAFELTSSTSSPNNMYPSPIMLSPDTDWADIAVGAGKTFAIKSNGTLWARGKNNNHVLGLNVPNNSYVQTLTQVGTDNNWKKIITTLNGNYTLALKTDNTLWEWGTTNDIFFSPIQTPTQIGTATWKEIALANSYAIGIKSDGTLWEWGAGRWVNGVILPANSPKAPVQVGTDTDWIKVAAGGGSYALKTNGTVWGWGAYHWVSEQNYLSSITPVLYFQCTSLSTTEHELSNIVLYPNPTVDKIFWAQNIAIEKVTIFDMNGKQILSQKVSDFSLDVSNLSSGTYLIKLESDEGFYNSKFIKK